MSGSTQLISGVSANSSAQVIAGTVHGSVYFGENSPLNRLPYAVEAPFNSYNRRREPPCLRDTRVELLREIYDWADTHDERLIFWLNGLAGTGKSTIARTVARKYYDNGQLGASFFFSRGGGDVGHAAKFFTTIAVQLAEKSEFLQQHISDTLGKNSSIATQSLGDQWRQLIIGPLSRLSSDSHPSSYILVVDALDECDDDDDIRTILQLLAEARSLEAVRLRVFLTSRAEVPIRSGFYQLPGTVHQDFVLHHISSSIVNHDIMIFFKYSLGLIGQQKPSLGVGWPGEETLEQLVQNASGLFIWAATACRFIQQAERAFLIQKRLAAILQAGSVAVEQQPEKHLDEIYTTVLRHAIPTNCTNEEKEEFLSMLKNILGCIVTLFSPLSICSLSRLLGIQSEEVDDCLDGLHAILDIPSDGTCLLRLHHPSFRDFLLDKDRCKDANFWMDEKHVNETIAAHCIELLSSSLKEDICGVIVPGTFVTDIKSGQIERCMPAEVQYACLYWVQHLRRGGAQLRDNITAERFLRNHFLHWLEALGWMKKLSEGILEIYSLESMIQAADSPSLHAFVHDMKRFALHNRATIELAPLQTYCSALLFAPVMSLVRRQFRHKMPRWIEKGPEVETNWSATLQILGGHSREVTAVAFSPNGKLLASGSADKTVRIWDAVTGAALQLLEGHSAKVSAVAFSPDGKLLASGSWDHTIRIWDATTGATLQFVECDSEFVRAFAFVADGKQVFGSSEKMLRIWDVATGAMLQIFEAHAGIFDAIAVLFDGTQLASGSDHEKVLIWTTATRGMPRVLKGHSGNVTATAFSFDGKKLASGSHDQTVRIWDLATTATLQTLKGHSYLVTAVAFSLDSTQLVSGSFDMTLRIWDVSTGAALQVHEGHAESIRAVAFSPDGKQLVSGSDDCTIRIWDAVMRTTPQILENHYLRPVSVVEFSPDGKQLASGSYDKTVRIWNPATGAPPQILKGHSAPVLVIAFSRNCKQLASTSNDYTVRIWNLTTGALHRILEGLSYQISAITFSPNGKLLAAHFTGRNFGGNTTVRIWDVTTGSTLLNDVSYSTTVLPITFSPDGEKLALGLCPMVRIWSTATRAMLDDLEGHSSDVRAVTFSHNGKRLASASVEVLIWDTTTGAKLQILKGHSEPVTAINFSPDCKQLVSGSEDKSVRIWDVATGAMLQIFAVSTIVTKLCYMSDRSILTNHGRLDKMASSNVVISPSTPSPQLPGSFNFQPWVFVQDDWIVHRKNRMLWLPPDYRLDYTFGYHVPLCCAVYDDIVCIGHHSGRVSFIKFSFPL